MSTHSQTAYCIQYCPRFAFPDNPIPGGKPDPPQSPPPVPSPPPPPLRTRATKRTSRGAYSAVEEEVDPRRINVRGTTPPPPASMYPAGEVAVFREDGSKEAQEGEEGAGFR